MAEIVHSSNNERVIKPEGSANIYLRRRDPYGFWYVSFEKGATPASLSDAFTTLPLAKAAVEAYLSKSPVRLKAAKQSVE